MIQINLIAIYELAKRYSGWIIAIVLLLVMYNCNPQLSHADVIKERDNKNKELAKKNESLLLLNKAKDKLIASSEKKVLEKEQVIKKLNGEIANEKAKGEKKVAQQSKYDLRDWQKYYQEQTNSTNKEVALTGNTLNFTREPLVSIGKKLVQFDVVRAELKITANILVETQNIVIEKDNIIENERLKSLNLRNALTVKDEIANNLKSNISDLEKDLKQASKPKLKPILVSAVLGVIAGFVIAK